MNSTPISIYVHLPWCVRKCPYCDFNSHTAGAEPPKRRYVAALQRDLARESRCVEGRIVDSIFLGGGTPSLFTPEEIAVILTTIRQHFAVVPNAEVTMEANPGSVECGAPAGYRAAGVNRLSIGAQSFDDKQLQTLGRIHGSDDIVRAVRDAQDSGFDNINIDVMHGLPGQDEDGALSDLAAAIALAPQHLSWYQLTLEPNTVFYARPPADLPDDDLSFRISTRGTERLQQAGFEQYEVSAYARDGRQCRHNLNYWLFGDYVAAGAGAHGKRTADGDIVRYQKPANPLQYMLAMENDSQTGAATILAEGERVFEFMLNGLRLTHGFRETEFCRRTGLTPADLRAASRSAIDKGLLERLDDGVWRPTELGARFLNDLQAEFLPEGAPGQPV